MVRIFKGRLTGDKLLAQRWGMGMCSEQTVLLYVMHSRSEEDTMSAHNSWSWRSVTYTLLVFGLPLSQCVCVELKTVTI